MTGKYSNMYLKNMFSHVISNEIIAGDPCFHGNIEGKFNMYFINSCGTHPALDLQQCLVKPILNCFSNSQAQPLILILNWLHHINRICTCEV